MHNTLLFLLSLSTFIVEVTPQEVFGCGGFVKSEVEINFSLIEVKLYTKQGSLKYQTDCAPINGYYMIPVYDKGDYVLKVEPPPGWTFEPESYDLHIDGVKDMCSTAEDINFQFTGFGVIGKVISKGRGEGPAGVNLSIKKKGKEEVLKTTVTESGGDFTFEKVLPGEYSIEASHAVWTFDTASASVTVGKETGKTGNSLVILGYDVKGQVLSEGEPIKGVKFVLYSGEVASQDITKCDKSDIKTLPQFKHLTALCHATSLENGFFLFPALPCGNYKLVPIFVGEKIKFDVVPGELDFVVEHNSLVLKKPFQVAGFTVHGKAVTLPKGPGVAFAKVKINGQDVTETFEDGTFTLDSMKAGTYTIDLETRDVYFDPKQIKVTPNNPELPEIVATRFAACGHIKVDKFPDSVNSDLTKRKVVITEKGQKNKLRTINPDKHGKFCTDLKPGFYIFRVEITPEELKAGLKLSPSEHELQMRPMPIYNLVFSQMRARVQGKVACLEKCKRLQLALASLGRTEERHLALITADGKSGTFEFKDIMPGKYRVSMLNEEWCWKEKTADIEVIDQDLKGVEFLHNGYVLACSLSHDITLNFAHDSTKDAGSFKLSKGTNKFCLAQPGVYTLNPQSCHKFQQDTYRFDTASPTVLSLTATHHLVEGTITMPTAQKDIKVTIRSHIDSEKEHTVLGPLTADEDTTASPKPIGKAKDGEKNKEAPEQQKGPLQYKFSYWARSGEKIEVVPSSAEYLFYPASETVLVKGDSCVEEVTVFEGKQGVFITGQITPALADVNIEILPEITTIHKVQLKTDTQGAFKVGPLHPESQYSVTAAKEGYVFTAVENKLGHFKAFKLGQVTVKVVDESSTPLQSVLLSLAGGGNYRSNNLTQKHGVIVFNGLSPGQYFLKPMMKEYKFDPVSQMVEVTEGSSVNIVVKGSRVAFSCYGRVTSLNSEAEQGVLVEAVGLGSDNCRLLQEESKSEPDGNFRIRGLQPECEYEVRLRGGDANQHIERAAPTSINVKASGKDIEGLHIIAFRRMNQLDISGNVITDQEFLPNIKVSLYKESNPDQPIHTVSLGKTSFFHMPSLTRDNKEYFLKLHTTLSRSAYDYKLPDVSFTANKTYRHFSIPFQPKRKTLEQELNHSSFLILPLTLFVVFLSYNYQKVLPVLMQGAVNIQTMLQKSVSAQSSAPSTQSLEPRQYDISPELLTELTTNTKKPKKPKKV